MADLDDETAGGHRDTILDFFLDHPDAAERTCETGHLTGSALVVDATGTRKLLMLHRKLGRWFQPGGHADGDANLAAVAQREAAEETGIADLRVALPAIDVDVHRVEPPGKAAHLHLDVRFLVVAPPGALEQANHESLALRWVAEVDLDALEPSVDASTRRLVGRGLRLAVALLA
ncbi:MAG: NUDIX hydrolase [Acidimicrobiia bacterium]|nr:NUDIX hydrolase [Acidimicrobiia bacterium]